jgi:hypothetical protein
MFSEKPVRVKYTETAGKLKTVIKYYATAEIMGTQNDKEHSD